MSILTEAVDDTGGKKRAPQRQLVTELASVDTEEAIPFISYRNEMPSQIRHILLGIRTECEP